jgi:hypothetical protein
MDNASGPKIKPISNRFAKRRRWHQHFTPTSSSWLDQADCFFALPADKQIKTGRSQVAKGTDRGYPRVYQPAE